VVDIDMITIDVMLWKEKCEI